MKLFRDSNGDLYRVDRETGEKILITPAEPPANSGNDSDPIETADTSDED